jgi:hypothetical protein
MAEATSRSTGPARGAPEQPAGGQAAPACPVPLCPICMTVTALGQARPELVEHLMAAGREVLLAMRSAIEARLEESEQPARLQRLTIE